MASEAQYEFFKFRYNEGQERCRELVARGQIFLSIVTLYIGFLSFKTSQSAATIESLTLKSSALMVKWSYGVTLVFLLIALLLVILALGIYRYQSISDPVRIIEAFGATPPTDDDFRDARIVDYAFAAKKNSEMNNKRAMLLRFATTFLFLAALAHVTFFILNNWN